MIKIIKKDWKVIIKILRHYESVMCENGLASNNENENSEDVNEVMRVLKKIDKEKL